MKDEEGSEEKNLHSLPHVIASLPCTWGFVIYLRAESTPLTKQSGRLTYGILLQATDQMT